jgi:flagellar biosynthesis/type III secretory pathway chaperone
MTRNDALRELFAHLIEERRLLESLVEVLEHEARALCAMDLDALLGLATRKQTLVDSQVWVTAQRTEKLAAFGDDAPTTLSALSATLDEEPAAELDALREAMRRAAARAAEVNVQNELFATSGLQLVSGVLRIVSRAHAGNSSTYAADGCYRVGGTYGQTRRRL